MGGQPWSGEATPSLAKVSATLQYFRLQLLMKMNPNLTSLEDQQFQLQNHSPQDTFERHDHRSEMTGSIVSVYNGETSNQVEIKPEMFGHYLREFFIISQLQFPPFSPIAWKG